MPQTASPLRWVLNAFRGGRGHPARAPVEPDVEPLEELLTARQWREQVNARLDALERATQAERTSYAAYRER